MGHRVPDLTDGELVTHAADDLIDQVGHPLAVAEFRASNSGPVQASSARQLAIWCMDAIARYSRLRGADTLFPVGWDSSGRPPRSATAPSAVNYPADCASLLQHAGRPAIRGTVL